MSFASHGAKAAAAIGAAAIYRKMREPARQNSPFRRAWELNLRLALGELDSLAYESEAPGDLTSSSDVADPGRPAAKPFVYVALGDSAAQGLGASSIARGYVPRIAAGLEAALDRRVILLNISLSGGTAESVLASQMPLLSGLQAGNTALAPDLVTLDIGGNDVSLQRLSVEDFSSLIDTICRGLPRPAVVANIPTFKPLASAERAALLSKAIDDAAKENGCGLVDLHGVSEDMSAREYMFTHHAADLFHPSDAWYHRWSELFMEQIASILGFVPPNMSAVPDWSGASKLRVE